MVKKKGCILFGLGSGCLLSIMGVALVAGAFLIVVIIGAGIVAVKSEDFNLPVGTEEDLVGVWYSDQGGCIEFRADGTLSYDSLYCEFSAFHHDTPDMARRKGKGTWRIEKEEKEIRLVGVCFSQMYFHGEGADKFARPFYIFTWIGDPGSRKMYKFTKNEGS